MNGASGIASWVIVLVCISSFSLKAGDSLSIRKLQTVEVSTSRLLWSQLGKRIIKFDSLILPHYQYQSLSDILSAQSPVFIKSYGPGALASSSLRGGNASQTAILWNGFNINHPMLGQSDFSQIPVFFFDAVEIEMGSAPALHGSGVINGSIQLSNTQRFQNSLKTTLQIGSGSFGMRKTGGSIHYSTYRFSSTTRLFYQQNQNNFRFLNDSGKTETRTHNSFDTKGALQDFSWLLNTKNKLDISFWYNQFDRQLPKPPGNKSESKASQLDKNFRGSINWTYFTSRTRVNLRQGIFSDALNYTDSLAGIFSKSRCLSSVSEVEANKQFTEWFRFFIGGQFLLQNAENSNYGARHQSPKRVALVGGFQLNTPNKKYIFSSSIRQEYSSLLPVPITGHISLEAHPHSTLHLKWNAARVYRLPTLNDWYWQPGGNPNLKPEQGYSTDGSLIFQLHHSAISFRFTGSLFYKNINNWIIWLPKNTYTSPDNLLNVKSRGGETQTELGYRKKSFYVQLAVQTTYVLSTVENSYLKEDEAIGKQLIYTPRYTGNGNLSIGYKKASVLLNHSYTGYRFTSSDNSTWLMPYHASSLKLRYTQHFSRLELTVYGALNNLSNSDYEIIQNYPVPLRNYEAGLTIHYVKSINKNKYE